MLFVENIQVFNFEGAMRGLRNPKDSWHLSDSNFNQKGCLLPEAEAENIEQCQDCPLFNGWGEDCIPYIGPKDMKLAQLMIGAGTDESKFLRQIFISMDITAPLYWWKEFDTYKVGTVANSCSTMHKLDAYPITREMFSWDNDLEDVEFCSIVDTVIAECERLRKKFKETGDKAYWRALIQILPESWMQKRTVTLNYQVARAMFFARRFHKLIEWPILCDVFLNLPYGKEFIAYEKPKKLDSILVMILKRLGIDYKNEKEQELSQEDLIGNILNYFEAKE